MPSTEKMTKKNEEKNLEEKNLEANFFGEFPAPSYEEWKEEAVSALKGGVFERKLLTKTHEGITLQPMYRRQDTEDLKYTDSLPGFFPYVRGIDPLGYLNKPWDIAQESTVPNAKTFNEVVKFDLEKGADAVNLVLDEASLLCEDADVADTQMVGNKGVSVSSLQDLNEALQGIDLKENPLYLNTGESLVPMFSLVMSYLKSEGKTYKDIKGMVGSDPLSVLVKEGSLDNSLDDLYDEMATVAKWANENTEDLRTIAVEGHVYSNGGANAIQELAFVVATGVEYLKQMMSRGLTVDQAAQRMRFSFSIGSNFFMEISKLRAARILWAQVVHSFGGNDESQKMIIHARTSAFTKTVYDPYVNMLRTTTETFSAVVGGINSMHLSPFDEPLREGTVFSRRIARNQQIMFKEEFNLLQPVDPAGGSWYIEMLTETLAEEAWKTFQTVEEKGGIYQALMTGFVQDEIDAILEGRFKKLEVRSDVKAGTNMYANMTEEREEAQVLDHEQIKRQRIAEIQEYRKDTDNQAKTEAVKAIDLKGENAIDTVIDAVSNGATIGEIAKISHKAIIPIEVKPIKPRRLTERFEAMRMDTEAHIEKTGKNVKVYLVNMGPIPQHKGRADFSTGFFEVAAFEVIKNDGHASHEEAVQKTLESGAEVAIICSTDKTYPVDVPAVAKPLKEANPELKLFLAGSPGDKEQEYRDAGIDDFVHVKANCYQILRNIQKERGIIAND